MALVGSAFLVGLTKAGFGAGATILAVPLMVVALGGSEEMLPIMLPVELLGLFIKPVALAIRLFANMVAGHTLLAVIASFGTMAMMATENWLTSGSISILAIIAAVPISFLELFVAFLQAFIFMFLTTVFIGQMTHHHEEHEEHEEHDEPHVPEGVLAH